MPRKILKRKGYGKPKGKLPYGIYAIARSVAREQAANRKIKSIMDASEFLGGGTGTARENVAIRRAAAIKAGHGMYTGSGAYGIRRTLGEFAKRNKLGQRALDAALGSVSGSGMYTGMGMFAPGAAEAPVASNSLISKSAMEVVPLFEEETDGGITISRREYVSEIYGPPLDPRNNKPQAFSIQTFAINPGLEKTFPWLSQIAQNYDEYELQQCIFTFKSTTTESSNSANGQVGTVIMATNYNAAQPAFTDKASMQHYEAACSARLTESMQHGIECDPSKRSGSEGLYVRSNPVVTNQDLKTYDHGLFQIAIANPSDVYTNVSLGELWVSYTINLRKSKFFTSLGLGISKDIFVSNGGESYNTPFGTQTAGTTMAVPSTLLKGQQNNLGVLLQTAATAGNGGAIKLTFPASYRGFLKLLIVFEGTGISTPSAGFNRVTTGNVWPVADLYGGGAGSGDDAPSDYIIAESTAGNTATRSVSIFHIQTQIASNGTDNTWSWVPNLPGSCTITQSYLEICEYNSGFSGKATNINSSDAPVLVNASGVVIVV